MINTALNKIVIWPKVSGNLQLYTYGTQDMGDIPRLALTDKDTPKAIIKSPKVNVTILNNNLFIFLYAFIRLVILNLSIRYL